MKRIVKYCPYLVLAVILLVIFFWIFFPSRSEPQQPGHNWSWETKSPLAEFLIALDPGHGGRDGGSNYGNIKEKDITLAIARKTKAVFEQWGGQALLTRDGDYRLIGLYSGERTRQRRDLLARVKVAQEENADLLVSIHVNAARGSFKGPMVFYQTGEEVSRQLAESILTELRKLERHQQQDLLEADYFILFQADIPAVLVEVGFITHPEERRKLQSEDYQQQIAQALARGIKNFLLAEKKPSQVD